MCFSDSLEGVDSAGITLPVREKLISSSLRDKSGKEYSLHLHDLAETTLSDDLEQLDGDEIQANMKTGCDELLDNVAQWMEKTALAPFVQEMVKSHREAAALSASPLLLA